MSLNYSVNSLRMKSIFLGLMPVKFYSINCKVNVHSDIATNNAQDNDSAKVINKQ